MSYTVISEYSREYFLGEKQNDILIEKEGRTRREEKWARSQKQVTSILD